MRTKKQEERRPKSLTIANPMYDTVFKRLMENDRVVKFFIGTLLEQEVLSVDVRPQEYTVLSKKEKKKNATLGYSVYRIDFMATVKTKEGEHKKILIEVQKTWDKGDAMRFRNYLADQYKRKDKVDGISIVLPITTIYVVGFDLTEIKSPCIKIGRNYIDLSNHQTIEAKDPFIEKLTHDSYIIQTKKITDERYRTKLDKLLSIFEQAHFYGSDEILKQYRHQPDDEDMQLITSILHEMGADPEERKQLELEAEAIRIIEDNYVNEMRIKDKAIEEKDKALEEKDKTIEEKDKTIEETRKINEEQAKALEETR
ncbi:MAG: hypothetical protein LBT24_01035, partial [Tannerella sp.]|nr:hypothetical protein [Tannerella sp.]